MNHSRKMVLIPADVASQSTQTPAYFNKDKKVDKELDKSHKLLYIILKIAGIQGFDSDFHIFDSTGNPIMNSDLVVLLNNALSSGKILHGENEFIKLLYDASVDPDWIINEHVRSKLINFDISKDITMNEKIDTKDMGSQTMSPSIWKNSAHTQTYVTPSFDSSTQTSTRDNVVPSISKNTQTDTHTDMAPSSDRGIQTLVPMETSDTQTRLETGNTGTQTLVTINNDAVTQTDHLSPNKRKLIKPELPKISTKKRILDIDQVLNEHNYSINQTDNIPSEGTEPIRSRSWEVPLPDSDDSDDDD